MPSSDADVAKWQTRSAQNAVGNTVEVRVLSSAVFYFAPPLDSTVSSGRGVSGLAASLGNGRMAGFG